MKNFAVTLNIFPGSVLFCFFLICSGSVLAEVKAINEASFETADGIIDNDTFTDRVVLVDFWASWCKPCLKSFPWMNEMHKKYADQGLRIVAVNLDKDEGLIEKFLQAAPANFTIAYDKSAILAKRFEVKAMPSSFYYGRDGRLAEKHLGFRESQMNEYEKRIRTLLGIE